jgi:predicted N-formylglutamate amidohydrolase
MLLLISMVTFCDVDGNSRKMTKAWEFFEGGAGHHILAIVDHASNKIPVDIELGLEPTLLDTHIALDIGVAHLARELGYHAVLGAVSRLVVDFNREEDAHNIIPDASDGHLIPGNAIDTDQRLKRIERFWRPYHAAVSLKITELQPMLLLSLHSFTPELASEPGVKRPWQVGVLYNQDDRAARIAIPLFQAAGIVTGDQLPYSGKLLNASMNYHAERRGIPYLGLEIRQDLIGDADGVQRWANMLRPIIETCAAKLAEKESGNARR